MTDYPELNEPTFVCLADIQLALLQAARSLPTTTPTELVTAVDTTIAEGALPPRLADLVKAIWDAKEKAPAKLKVVGARVAQFLADTRQMMIGQSGDGARIRLAFMRELGVEGTWPDPADDPAHGAEPAPVDVPAMPMPRDMAVSIYRRMYWDRPGYALVAQRMPTLAAELFDTAVNMGPSVANAFLQRALNALNRGANDYPDVSLDGAIGPRTLAALDAFKRVRGASAEVVLLKAVEALQGERYLHLAERNPSQEAFLFGWLMHRIGQAL